jgi:hypothetical protein
MKNKACRSLGFVLDAVAGAESDGWAIRVAIIVREG